MKSKNITPKNIFLNIRLIIAICFMICTYCNLFAQNVTVNPGGGSYPTLAAALAAVNAGTHTGAVIVDIVNSTAEAGPCVLNSSGAGSASYTSVIIRPANDGVTVSGATTTGRGLIELKGADNVTIDGDNPITSGTNQNLTITNTAAANITYTSVIRIATALTVVASADNNIIRNCILNGSATGRNTSGTASTTGSENTTFGIYCGGNGGATATDAPTAIASVTTNTAVSGTTINNLLINNNTLNSCARAVVFNGAVAGVSLTGTTVSNNTIGTAATLGTYPFTSPSTTVYTKGIWINGTTAITISGNTIRNILSYVPTAMTAIELVAAIGAGTINISNNSINGVSLNASSTNAARGILVSNAGAPYTISGNTISNIFNYSASSTNQPAGIQVTTSATSAIIEKNKVSKVYNLTPSGGYGSNGIYLAGGNTITVRNNFVSDINHDASSGASFGVTFTVFGIRVSSGTGHNIYYNSVYLFGSLLGTATSSNSTFAFAITGTGQTGMIVRNNIFSNTMTGGTTSIAFTSIYLPAATATLNLTLNSNIYYTGSDAAKQGIAQVGTTAGTGFYLPGNFNPAAKTPATNLRAYTSTLASVTNNDSLSKASSTPPPFISNTDLHIDISAANASDINAAGLPAGGILTDIDGDARDVSTPDIGADEFTLPACSGTPNPGNTIASVNPVCPEITFSLSIQFPVSGTGVTYQWQSADDSLFTTNVTNLGTNSTQPANQATAKYYRCSVTCSSGPTSSSSAPVLVNMIPFSNCYCTPVYSSGVEPITLVNFAGINNSSCTTTGCGPSLENFTGITGIAALNSTNPIIVKGNTVGNFTDSIRVWIDFNHNGLFTDAGESFNLGIITNTTGTDAVQASGNILIPNTALTGATRMRVAKLYNGSGINLPCVSSGYGQAEDYSLLIVSSSSCTAPPSPGNTISGANPVCPGVNFTLSLQNLTAETGISYQWQSADDNAFTINVTNLDTNSSQPASQTSAKYYRCLVTCSSGPFTTSSIPLLVTMNSFSNCYCTPVFATNSDPVTLVDFAGINNASCATKNCSPSYENFTAITGNVTQGITYPINVKAYTDGNYTFYVRVFIDYNQNGMFTDAGETINAGTITNSTGLDAVVATTNITIPITALTGTTRMRVTSRYSTAASSCETSGEGQAEDYLLNIAAAPNCSGSPSIPVASAQQTQLCIGNTVAHLSITGYSNTVSGITHQWKSSSTQGGPYTNIAGANSDTYTSGALSAATYFVCLDSCIYSQQTSQSNGIAITIVDPQITGTTTGSRCGAGTVNLSATANGGSSIDWYAAAVGGSSLYTGSPFTTPVIGATTTYYASASIGGSSYSGGKPSSNGADGTNTEGGIFFTASQQFTLNSVVMYPTGAGTNTIVLYAGSVSSGTPVYTIVANFSGASTTGVIVPLGWSISPGNYTIYSTGGTAACWRDYSASSVPLVSYPYTIGPACTLTDGSLAGYYYFFFNWSISTGCVSTRVPVVATVSTAPAITVSSSPTICSGQSTVLSVSSSNDPNYQYTWTPGSLPGSSVSVSPVTTTIYTVSALDNSGGANQGCANSATVAVNVNPSPANITASIINPVCLESPASLSAAADPYNIVILSSDFNSGAQGWTSQNNGGNAATVFTLHPDGYNIPTYGTAPVHSNDNSQFYLSNSSASTGNTRATLQSPAFSTMDFTSCNVSLYQYYKYWTAGDSIVIEASTNGTTWSLVKVYANADIGNYSNFMQDNVNLNAYINQPTVYVRFRYRSTFSYWWAIDNIVISGNYNSFTYAWSSTPSGYSSALKNPLPFLPNASISYYSVTLTNTYGCTNTGSTGVLNYTTPPHPYLEEGDSVLCSNDAGFNIHVLDAGAYPGGYPAGTTFDFYGAGAILYQSSTSNTFFNANNSDAFYAVVTLPGSLNSCSGTSDTSVIDFGSAQAPQYVLTTDSVKCYDGATGNAIATITFGGTANYRWQWYSSGYNNLLRDVTNTHPYDSLKGVPAGMYIVVLTDHQGATFSPYCQVIDSIYVGQPGAPLTVKENTANHVNVLCFGKLTGAIDINVGGSGTSPYSYNWSNGASTQDLNGIGAGTYTCTVTDSRGCTAVITIVITQGAPVVVIITGSPSICAGNTNTLNAGAGYSSYLWSTGATTQTILVSMAGTYTVTVTIVNGCTGTASVTTVVNPKPVPAISGAETICLAGTAIISASASMSSYSWSTGATTQSIDALGGTYTVTVTNVFGCTASATKIITITAGVPAQPGVIAGTIAVCKNSNITFSIANVPGATGYTWTAGSGASVSTGQGSATVVINFSNAATSGNLIVTASNVCGSGASRTLAYTVSSAIPAATATINGTLYGLCNQTNVAYNCPAVPNATSYLWTVPAEATLLTGQGTNAITVKYLGTFANTGTISVVAQSGCGNSAAISRTVNAKPAQPVISGQNWACKGQPGLVYSVTPIAGAASYTWTVVSGSTLVSGQGTTSIVVNWGGINGQIKCTANNACGSSLQASLAVSFTCKEAGSVEDFSDLSLFPNPTSATATLQFDGFAEGKAQLTVYDLMGGQLLNQDVKVVTGNNEYKLDLVNYPKGVYAVRVIYNGVTRNSKLIVQ